MKNETHTPKKEETGYKKYKYEKAWISYSSNIYIWFKRHKTSLKKQKGARILDKLKVLGKVLRVPKHWWGVGGGAAIGAGAGAAGAAPAGGAASGAAGGAAAGGGTAGAVAAVVIIIIVNRNTHSIINVFSDWFDRKPFHNIMNRWEATLERTYHAGNP